MIGDYQICSTNGAVASPTVSARPPEGVEWQFVVLKAAHTDDGAARNCYWQMLRDLPGAVQASMFSDTVSLAHSTYQDFSWNMASAPGALSRGTVLLANHWWYPQFYVTNIAAGKYAYVRALVIERPEKIDIAILNAQGVDIQVPYRR